MSRRSRISHPRPWSVRFCALLWILSWSCAAYAVGALAYGIILKDDWILQTALGSLLAFIILGIFAFGLSHNLSCSVCGNPVLSVRRCNKHRKASKFLGISYRLGVAIPAFFISKYRCMYCGEKIPLGLKASSSNPRGNHEPAPVVSSPTPVSIGDLPALRK